MTYSPFPEHELEALARENDEAAKKLRNAPKFAEVYAQRAAMLRNAILCHEAVRERALLAELKLTQVERQAIA